MSIRRRIVDRLSAGPAVDRLAQWMAAVRYDLSWRMARPGAFQQRFEHAIATMPQGICLYDAQNRLQLFNEQFCKLFNQPSSRLRIGMHLYDVIADSCTGGNYPYQIPNDIYQARLAIIERRQRENFFQEMSGGRLIAIYHQPLEDGGWVSTYEDVTERRRAEEQIEFMAQHDGLTRLPNRLLFNKRLDEAIENARQGVPFALLYLDLDGFKDVNDRLGHAAGDLLLQNVAERLLKCIRKGDTAARLGGDEFAMVLPKISIAKAVKTAQRITAALNGVYALGAFGEAQIGVSIGIACVPDHAVAADALLLLADKALYAAKHSGLGIPRLYDDRLESFAIASPVKTATRRKRGDFSPATQNLHRIAELGDDLRNALHDGHVYLLYQPIYDTVSGRPVACEALCRWTDPDRGVVSPLDFIPAAEESGFIGPLTEWVLLNACREAARWDAPIQITVNLSPLTLSQPALVDTVARILAETGLPASRLVLELTEGIQLGESEAIQHCLRGLKALGVEVWLDDFGTGYANLGYLRRLECSTVKIDRSFLVPHDKRREVLAGMISLAHGCGLKVVVEGMETADDHRLLQELGCDLLQGFLFARPMSPEQIVASLHPMMEPQV